MATSADPYIQTCLISLQEAAADIMSRFPVDPAEAMITLFELNAQMLRRWAPGEFDRFLNLFAEQLSLAPEQREEGPVNEAREELIDIILLVSS